mgnify:CR=1 FL=1
MIVVSNLLSHVFDDQLPDNCKIKFYISSMFLMLALLPVWWEGFIIVYIFRL